MRKYFRHNLLFNALENTPLSRIIDIILPPEVFHVFGHGVTSYILEILTKYLEIEMMSMLKKKQSWKYLLFNSRSFYKTD